MIHRKAMSLMSTTEAIAQTAATALSQATSQQTGPTGSTVTHNADGTKTITGSVLGTDSTGTSVTTATHVGDTTPPGVPTGVAAWSGDGSLHVSWDGTLEGGIPADFDHVTLYARTGTDAAITLGTLTASGSVTSSAVVTGTTYDVTATAEDDACDLDGTAAHNVSAACAAVSVAVTDVAGNTDQHFWADSDGAHVSSTGDHDLSGLNLLLTSAKLAFRKVLAELLTIDAVNGVISFLGGLVTIRGVEWHRGGTDYEGVGMHSTEGTEITCDSSWDGEPARVAVGRTGPAGETGGCVYLEGQRIFAKDPSLAADGANASMAALWALLVGTDTHITAGIDAVTLYKRIATVIQPVVLFDKWDNAINAGCTLSETAAGFVRLLIEFKTDDNHKSSVMVTPVTGATSVDGQVLDLTCNVFNPGSGMFVKSKAVQISGTTIGTYNSSGWWTGLWGLANGNVLGDYITIVKVTGWR